MRRKWSKDKIVETIKNLEKKNIDISAKNISKNNMTLFVAASARRYFSSWANAVNAAGIDYNKILEIGKARRKEKLTKWSNEKVLDEIRSFETGRLLTTYRHRLALYSAARRAFGSWEQALEVAGYGLAKGTNKNANHIFKKGKNNADSATDKEPFMASE